MELGLEKKKITQYITVHCGSMSYDESTEMIVTDQSPDIARIIKGCADAFLKDKNARDGKVDVSGVVKGAVLYVAEGEQCVRKLDISMPFAYVIDGMGVSPDSSIIAQASVRSLDVREINPRKVSVRACVEVSVCAYKETEQMLCEEVRECDTYGICMRKKKLDIYSPIRICSKSFSISDDVELSANEEDMSGILTSTVKLVQTDTKIIGNKIILKGNATVAYVYSMPDGGLGSGEYELPFSQIVDIDGMNESSDLKITMSVCGFELEPQYDAAGKARYMTASIATDASIVVFEREKIEVVDDIYSTQYPIETNIENIVCKKLHNKVDKRIAVTESIETGCGIKQVLDVAVSLAPPVRRRDEGGEILVSDAAISVMYIGDDDGIYSANRRTTAVCPMPLDNLHTYDSSATVRSKSFSVGASNEINVRFFTDFDITETEEISVPVIATVNADTDNIRDVINAPSVVVKRLSCTVDIWSLAKEYCTTVEEIKLANDLVDDSPLSAGRMVLIPKKR